MKIHNCRQGSEEWLRLRAGIPTASELDALVSPLGKVRTGEGPNTYVCTKAAEKWLGGPLQSFGGGAMEQGSILEGEALPWFELHADTEVKRIGFVTTDDGRFGASPDGLLPDDSGLEIKCPQPHTHVKWLLAGGVPPEHRMQCYGGMYATGAKRWTFLSYCRSFPPLVVEFEGYAPMMAAIGDALDRYTEAFNVAMERLKEADGACPVPLDDHPF